MSKHKYLTEEQEKMVINYFLTNNDNRIVTISNNLKLSKHLVSKTIDDYLKTLKIIKNETKKSKINTRLRKVL